MTPRVGVLTLHRCINYGSYWQAHCLVQGLRARGHDAVLLDHDSLRVTLAEWRCALSPVLPTPTPPADQPLYRRKIRAFVRAFGSLPLSRRFSLAAPHEMESFDVVVVGSDEVWNLRHPWYGGYGVFFGAGVRARRLISYAASFGSYSAWEGLDTRIVEHLRAFERLSVRDGNSRELVGGALGLEPELALDPCLQFPVELPSPEPAPEPGRPFVAIYGHNFSESFAREVRRWATARGCALVSVGYRNDWADEQRLAAGPHEFAALIAGGEAVATNFFHGCVFALREAKPFVAELSPYRANKVLDLLRTLEAEERLVWEQTPAATYAACLTEPPSQRILARIGALRAAANGYLDAALA